MHLSLTPKLEQFVKSEVEAGRYSNASEVVREALQEFETVRRLKLKRLKSALAKGEADLAAGRFARIEDNDDLTEFFARL